MPTLTLPRPTAPPTTTGRDGLTRALAAASSRHMRITGTAQHSRRVAEYAARTAAELGHPPTHAARIRMAGLVHDVGKAWIPARVLLKPGLLAPHEWMLIEAHPITGAGLLTDPDTTDIAHWIRTHHERPDGRGYPLGLLAHEIPPEALILAVAYAYDAMTRTRPTSPALDRAAALAELALNEGTQFDPQVAAAFRAVLR